VSIPSKKKCNRGRFRIGKGKAKKYTGSTYIIRRRGGGALIFIGGEKGGKKV